MTKNNLSATSALEIEQKILAILLNSTEMRNQFLLKIRVGDFLNAQHKIIFQAILDLAKSHQGHFDLVLLTNYLKNREQLNKIGGAPYLSQLLSLYIADDFLKQYLQILFDNSIRFQIGEQLKNWSVLLKDNKKPADIIFRQINKNLVDLEQFYLREQKVIQPLHEIVGDFLTEWKNFKFTTETIDCTTGFIALDKKTKGFHKGDLIILAARPSMGKTALALKIAMSNAFQLGRNQDNGDVIIFSLEMSERQLARRLINSYLPQLKKANFSAQNFEYVEDFKEKLTAANIFIDASMSLDVLGIQFKLQNWIQKRKIKLVIIDYLQLLKPMLHSRFENRNLEVSFWTRKLKEIARELKIPVVCVSQLSRSVEKREDKKPLLSDLRDSGSIEQDADLVLFLYREHYYRHKKSADQDQATSAQDNFSPHKAELIIAKQRNGPIGAIDLMFVPEKATFYEAIDDE